MSIFYYYIILINFRFYLVFNPLLKYYQTIFSLSNIIKFHIQAKP